MSERQVVRIGDLGKVTTGRTPPSSRPECFGDLIPFITPSDMTGSRTVQSPQRFLSKKGAELLRKCVVEKGVAVSCIGWQMGKTLLVEKPSVTNQQINTIVPDCQDVELLYLYYALSSRRDEIFRLGSGGSRTPILNKSAFSQLEVAIPPLEEQQRIAEVLGTLDDKIELNRQMNGTLEAIARAIFKSWFIDFDPVIDNAILSGKPIPDEFSERAAVRREILARSQPSPPAPLPEVEGSYRGAFEFSGLVEKARELRQKQTPVEEIMWELLRNRRFLDMKFRRQHQIGDYIADFYCHDHKLVIELDGGIHQTREAKDAKRDAYLESLGMTVLRFPNSDVLDSPDHVLPQIAQATGLSPSPLGRGGGEGVVGYRHLFPDSFQDSPLGKIPKGWEVGTIGDLCEVQIGGDWGQEDPFEGSVAVRCLRGVDLGHLREQGDADAPIRWIRETSLEKRSMDDRDVLIAASGAGPLGRVLWASPKLRRIFEIPVIYSNFCKRLRASTVPEAIYLEALLAEMRNTKEIWEFSTGTSIPNLDTSELLEKRQAAIPSMRVLETYSKYASIAVEHRYTGESARLSTMRDALLPKLILGKLPIQDAGRFVRSTAL